ncbi:MAG: insulinase family protein [Anaerolineae bacterium]|nr:insulinase family protein [Gloeobacterales cyanobacterium ES-bin-313]
MYRTTLPNGLEILVIPNPTVDIVSTRFFFKSGSRQEPKPGVAHLLSALLTKGTEQYSSMELAHKVESIGAMLGADSNPDYTIVFTKSLSEDFPELLDLTAQLLYEATFPEEQLELERKNTLQSIRSQQERPFTVAYNQFRTALYGDHPYAYSDLGTEESVNSITREDLVTFYKTYFRPDNAVFVVVGPVEPKQVVALAEKLLSHWSAPETPIIVRSLLKELIAHPVTLREVQPTQQSTVLVGYEAVAIASPDFPVLKLIGTYLGSGLSSRLFTELREKRGLAYEVSAFFPTRVDTSHFVTYIGTAPENAATCEEGLQSETQRLCDLLLSDEELRVAKNKLIGQHALGKQTNSQIAQLVGTYEAIGVGADFDKTYIQAVEAVTREAIQSVAQSTFRNPIISLVGPEEVAKMDN